MVSFQVRGTERLVAKLSAAAGALPDALGKAAWRGAQRIQATAKKKVSGPVLKVRTNRLRSSIQTKQLDRLAAAVGTDVVYAAIHEFGGRIPAHMVKPRHKKALRWVQGGRTFFSRGHMIPEVTMPKSPFLTPSAEEHRDEIIGEFQGAIAGVLDK